MKVAADLVRQLRETTGAGIMECRKALEETGSSMEKAVALLRERGVALAASKEGRKAREGLIMAYVHHGGKLGALVELNCESDFVARNEEFVTLTKELAMQIAATSPKWVSREDVPADWLAGQQAEFGVQAEVAGKVAQKEEFVKERTEQLLSQVCLLEQPYIRDSAVIVGSLITDKVAKFKEKMKVRRFVIYKLGATEE